MPGNSPDKNGPSGPPDAAEVAQRMRKGFMIGSMDDDVAHVTSAEAIRDIAAILDRVERGAEVIVEKDQRPVALIQPAPRPGRLLSECIALARAHEAESGRAPTLDDAFGTDLQEIIASRPDALESRWD
jgi:antitoxin (DNA-binding transcriptional repressor) of toxin-antitoxin stability system